MLLLFNLLCEVIHVLFTCLICYLSLVALPTFTNTTDAVHTCQCLILLTYKGIVQFFKTDLAHVLFYCWFFSLKCEVRPYRAPVKLIYITLELFGLVIGSRRDRQFLLGECSDFLGLVFGSAAVHMRLLIRLQGLGREGFISVVQPDIGLGFEHISISIILIIPIEQKLIF